MAAKLPPLWAVIIVLGLGIPLGILLGTSMESSTERRARVEAEATAEAADAARQEAEAKARTDERAAKLERLRKVTCTPEKERVFMPFVGDRIGMGVLVDPDVWEQLEYLERVGFSGWVSLCLFDGEDSFIKHGKTGKNLAMFSLDLGYVNSE